MQTRLRKFTLRYLYRMKIADIISFLESVAPAVLQEHYDNAGLITGDPHHECTGILIALDATTDVIEEARQKNCNLVVAHHPLIFSGLKKISNSHYVGQAVIAAIKQDIAIYAIHTNLDNVIHGVNGKIAQRLGLQKLAILAANNTMLKKIYTFAPVADAEKVRNALFEAGAGHIGKYDECSFNVTGEGTFRAGDETRPFVGEIGKRHYEKEIKIEMIYPAYLEKKIIQALMAAHPYEEVAYDLVSLTNSHQGIGSGIIGQLENPMSEIDFLKFIKNQFGLKLIRHTPLRGQPVKTVALCGGAGSFLISKALACGADFFITSDIKYHEFFDANGRIVIADIGHYESEQFTISLLQEILEQKFPTFAVLKTEVNTNPVRYYL